MDDLKSAATRIADVIASLRDSEPSDTADETTTIINDAITTLQAAEREITARLKIGPGQCRASHTDDDGETIRCEHDAGHDGPHEDGDWGWTAEPRYAPPAAAGPESKLSPCQVATRDLPCP